MRYFGREDFGEGMQYPVGFHWGYIHSYVRFTNMTVTKRLEKYMVIRIPTPLHMVKHRLDADCYWIHEWTMLAFAAWPYQNFPSQFRYRCTHFWSPVYGS